MNSYQGLGAVGDTEPQAGAGATLPPLQIGKYEVSNGEPLGSGRFGLVLRAFDPILRQPRALKVPSPDVLSDPGKRQRFLTDAVALARLEHKNVVRVFDADECGSVCYIAMELCECGSLDRWLGQRAPELDIPWRWAADLVRQIASGVQHAHERRIYHRDLKPANILLTLDEGSPIPSIQEDDVLDELPPFCPKVSDFNLAKILDEDNRHERTEPGALLGTKAYMAPEQTRGDLALIGPATDVYALGVILFELVTRRLPFEGPGVAALFDQIRYQPPPRLSAFRRDVPPDLETVCLACLEKRPRDRYQSPSELANELDRVLKQIPPLRRPAPLWKRVVARVQRHRAGAALLALTIAIALTSVWLYNFVRQGNVDVLFRSVKAAQLGDLPDLVRRLDSFASDRNLATRLGRLFAEGTRIPKLAAALALLKAGGPNARYSDYCFGELLDAAPAELGPIVRLLQPRMPGLASRLQAEIDKEPLPRGARRVAQDRRRANAANALIVLDSGADGWSLFRFEPDPQARTFLIHRLGSSGIDPQRVVERVFNRSLEPRTRAALIQCLGRFADSAWSPGARSEVIRRLFALYQDDSNAAVHGSAKWLLRAWGSGGDVARIDSQLAAKRRADSQFQWRISNEGLTLLTLDDPDFDRVIEVSDSEITIALFRRLCPTSVHSALETPDTSCPVEAVSYYDAAAFCNLLNSREGLSPVDACYLPTGRADQPYKPAPGQSDLAGLYG
jgi:serine/threonine protein kinase